MYGTSVIHQIAKNALILIILNILFFYCPCVKYFWDQVENWWFSNFDIQIKFTVVEILLGVNVIATHLYFPINYVILIGKYFIYKCKK